MIKLTSDEMEYIGILLEMKDENFQKWTVDEDENYTVHFYYGKEEKHSSETFSKEEVRKKLWHLGQIMNR